MKLNVGAAAAMGCVVTALWGWVAPAWSCGGDEAVVMFSYPRQPDETLERYAMGHLGIVRPGFASSYLVVAYRYLSGAGLSEREQEAVLAVWRRRLGLARPALTDWRSR